MKTTDKQTNISGFWRMCASIIFDVVAHDGGGLSYSYYHGRQLRSGCMHDPKLFTQNYTQFNVDSAEKDLEAFINVFNTLHAANDALTEEKQFIFDKVDTLITLLYRAGVDYDGVTLDIDYRKDHPTYSRNSKFSFQ